MPKGSAISPALRQQWLEEHDHGKRLDVIAREAQRGERTVQTHIARARQERDQREIRSGLLRDAYRQHYSDLIGVAREIQGRAAKAETSSLLAFSNRRGRLLLQALQEHLSKARLWMSCKRWDTCADQYADIAAESRAQLAKRLPSQLPEPADLIGEGWLESLWFAMRETARGNSLGHMQYRCMPSEGDPLTWGTYGLARHVTDDQVRAAIADLHTRAIEAVTRHERLVDLRGVLQHWQRAREDIDEDVEILQLQYLLPGECLLCPSAAGIAPVRRRRRNRQGGADED